jgi:hypothetical protein
MGKTRKRIGVLICAVIAPILLFGGIIPAILYGVTPDYWIWLGCPFPLVVWDNYPGHDLTAVYRHEEYFKEIPRLYFTYDKVVTEFGHPIRLEEVVESEGFRTLAVYENFSVGYQKDSADAELSGSSPVLFIVVTSDRLSFTRDKIRVGDTKERVLHNIRYYTAIAADSLDEGYSHGYIDGSFLQDRTWVEFAYDSEERIERIRLFNQY